MKKILIPQGLVLVSQISDFRKFHIYSLHGTCESLTLKLCSEKGTSSLFQSSSLDTYLLKSLSVFLFLFFFQKI